MRIGIVCHYFPPHIGGLENVAYQQAVRLSKAGHDVAVLTSAGPDIPDKNFRLKRVPVWNYLEQKLGVPFPIFGPSLISEACKLARRSDVLHVHDAQYLSSFVIAFWAFILHKPLIVTQHVAIVPHPKKIIGLIQSIVFLTAGRLVYKISKKITILNTDVYDFLIKHNAAKNKIIFLPNGVDCLQFCPASKQQQINSIRQKYGLPINKTIALFVGRFVPKKGFSKLLECASDDYIIAFAGGLAPRSGLAKSLIFLGSLSTDALAEVYKAADIFILPSEGEGFPLTIQEAMASGLPIITTNQAGYSIYKFDNKLIKLIDSNLKNIQESLQLLSANSKLRQSMAAYSLDYVKQNFSWQRNVAELQKIYHKVIL